uniref:ADP-dependent glucokinase/phosphofructokinase n=1 Tax=Actinosynnema sp. TaxID=1872144 RepID=UPI003F86BA0D
GLVADRAGLVAAAGPVVAGFSATTDALHRITDETLTALVTAGPTGSAALDEGLRTLRSWLVAGRDGELFIDDEAAEPLLEALAGPPEKVQCGGTSIQACWSWSALGVEPLLALTNRSERQLAATADGVRLVAAPGAEGGGGRVVPVREVAPVAGPVVPSNHVLELARGLRAPGVEVRRSSRITVVLTRKRPQLDAGFLARSPGVVGGGVGLVSGLNGLGREREQWLPRIAEAVRGWREGGARLVHLELADYRSREELARVMALVGPWVDSVGMNGSELAGLVGDGDPATAATSFAAAHGLGRVVVHSDGWALSAHRGDPAVEARALAAGSLAAANRAENGEPRGEWRVPAEARFAVEVPAGGPTSGGYRASVVATPYLTAPRSTIGLGDTFVSGDLLVQAGVTHIDRGESPS